MEFPEGVYMTANGELCLVKYDRWYSSEYRLFFGSGERIVSWDNMLIEFILRSCEYLGEL